MSKIQISNFKNSVGDHQKEIVKIMQQLSRVHGMDQVWSDWVEICAITLARLDQTKFDTRESRYLDIVKKYKKEELHLFVIAFASLVKAFDHYVEQGEIQDVLGQIYMAMNMGNDRTGQFFTPFDVSLLMARITITPGTLQSIEQWGFMSMSEPTCGAGGMVIASARAVQESGYNYQKQLHVMATDIDSRCVHMTFIQMALLHIPGIVVHGNGLSQEHWNIWYTPAHIMDRWSDRILERDKQERQISVKEIHSEDLTETEAEPENFFPELLVKDLLAADQLQLF